MHKLVVFLLACASATGPALAAEVTFTGTVGNTCQLTVAPLEGKMVLSAAGDTLASDEDGGLAAEIAILSIGANTITVASPTRTSAPATYVPGDESIEVAYSGLLGLSAVDQEYTSDETTLQVNIIPLSTLFVHNRIVNSEGFASGVYKTKTVITCS